MVSAVRIIDGGGGKVGSCGDRIWILVEATAWLDGYGAMRMVAAAMMWQCEGNFNDSGQGSVVLYW